MRLLQAPGWALLLFGLASSAHARQAVPYPQPVTSTVAPSGYEIAYDDGSYEFWGGFPQWTAEEQVRFAMPAGGPWLVVGVRFFMSGTGEHVVWVRNAANVPYCPPGPVVRDPITFSPGYAGPPDRYVEVDLCRLGIILRTGQSICVGTSFEGTDGAIGLDQGEPGGYSWGYLGRWLSDSHDWQMDAGIRLVLLPVVAPAPSTTWSRVKALYR